MTTQELMRIQYGPDYEAKQAKPTASGKPQALEIEYQVGNDIIRATSYEKACQKWNAERGIKPAQPPKASTAKHSALPAFAIPGKETRTEKQVNWHKAFCTVCQPIVDRHFLPREAYLLHQIEELREQLWTAHTQYEKLAVASVASVNHAQALADALRAVLDGDDDAWEDKAEQALAAYEKASLG